MKFSRLKTIKQRLLFSISMIVGVSLLIVVLVSLRYVREGLTDAHLRQLSTAKGTAENLLESFRIQSEQYTRLLQGDATLSENLYYATLADDTEGLSDVLKPALEHLGVHFIIATDSQGKLILEIPHPNETGAVDQLIHPAVTAIETKEVSSAFVTGKGRTGIMASAPVMVGGDVTGTVCLGYTMDTPELAMKIHDILANEAAFYQGGRLLSTSFGEGKATDDLASQTPEGFEDSELRYIEDFDFQGTMYDIQKVAMRNQKGEEVLTLALFADKTAFNEGWSALLTNLLWVSAVFLIGAVFVGVWTAVVTTRPIRSIVDSIASMRDRVVGGMLDQRVDPEEVDWDFKPIADNVNELIDALTNPLKLTLQYIEGISVGRRMEPVEGAFRGDFERMKQNLNTGIEAINRLVTDAGRLTEAVAEERFDVRVDAEKHQGEYRRIIEGVNRTMEIVNRYVRQQAEVTAYNKQEVTRLMSNLNRLAEGNFELELEVGEGSDAVLRDRENFSRIAQSLLVVKNAVFSLAEGVQRYTAAVEQGELHSLQFEAKRYHGTFRVIFEGLNNALDATRKPLDELLKVFGGMARGDLTSTMQGLYNGVFGELKESGNRSIEEFNKILGEVNQTTQMIASGSLQVADASGKLSQGASEQAASLVEISASMQQISAQSSMNAENAKKAHANSLESQQAAERGNRQMIELVTAMNQVNQAAGNISRIIKTIDEIAFQTNILSLNAAVEAARAGRHGKGFAVVAEAVRNLAARSAKAARETSDMLEDSIRKITRGTELSTHTADALKEIVTDTSSTLQIVGNIADSSREQAKGVEEVNAGLNQIEQVTQSNTAIAEQSAAAASQLSELAGQLKTMMKQFKLGATEYDHALPALQSGYEIDDNE